MEGTKLFYILAFVIIAIDQLTKWMIVTRMTELQSIPVIDDFFYITSHRNTGAAWGILEGQMFFFYIITVIVVIAIIFYMERWAKEKPLAKLALAFMLGGAIGNLIDRVFRQEVVDFFQFFFGTYQFPIFNVADSSLVVGVILLMIIIWREDSSKEKEQPHVNS
ncbi:signal peptidase II [Bacillus fonticola]|uniref:signal peptidase II n=1 Tax=Bacillus fonticola TaxID=2728853 RepID=UPI001D136836|nr:signal peptidase II [Bacillus fonticola]